MLNNQKRKTVILAAENKSMEALFRKINAMNFFLIISIIILLGLSSKSVLSLSSANFPVTLTIQNFPPVVNWVDNSVMENPIENSQKEVYILFNVTDNNGASDINDSSINMTLNKTGEPDHAAICSLKDSTTLEKSYNCSVVFEYYDNNGDWTINASAQDLSGAYAENLGSKFTYGTLAAMTLNISRLDFGAMSLGESKGSLNGSLGIKNTGNADFSQIRLTGFGLVGSPSSDYTLGARNFTVNTVDAVGQQLINNTPVAIVGASLPIGPLSLEELYIWVSIPSYGLIPQVYHSTDNWVIDVS